MTHPMTRSRTTTRRLANRAKIDAHARRLLAACPLLLLALALRALSGCAAFDLAPSPEPTAAASQPLGAAPCPPNAHPSAVCESVSITCPGAPAIDVRLAVVSPPGLGVTQRAPAGTVITLSGTGGKGFDPRTYPIVDRAVAAGFKVVAAAWQTAWQDVPSHDLAVAGCRPEKLRAWAVNRYHSMAGQPSRGLCGLGSSGGASALTYTSGFDAVFAVEGISLAMLPLSCDGATPNRLSACGAHDTIALVTMASQVGSWTGTACGATPADAGDVTRWTVQTADPLTPPAPVVELIRCTGQATAAGIGELYLAGLATPGQLSCVPSCSGEGVLDDPAGVALVGDRLLAGCVGGGS